MSLVADYNQRAMTIWKSAGVAHARMPLLLPSLKESPELLIVGMNPSFNVTWLDDQLAESTVVSGGPWTAEKLFAWTEESHSRIQHVIEFEVHARAAYASYFSRIQNFASEVGCSDTWEHLDVFLMRETSQKEALKMVMSKHRPIGALNSFGQMQLELFTDTVVRLRPKVVLVANATAGELLKQLLGPSRPVGEPASLEFTLLPHTRFFFSGMLSGQRCMDNFSLERLVAQVSTYVAKVRSVEPAA